jgi:hypothetical protein
MANRCSVLELKPINISHSPRHTYGKDCCHWYYAFQVPLLAKGSCNMLKDTHVTVLMLYHGRHDIFTGPCIPYVQRRLSPRLGFDLILAAFISSNRAIRGILIPLLPGSYRSSLHWNRSSSRIIPATENSVFSQPSRTFCLRCFRKCHHGFGILLTLEAISRS